jgi:hypothetical protein
LTKLPLAELIQSSLRQLDLTPQELGFRLGYSNPAKAVGRVYALCEGHLDNRKSRAALVRLADALELPAGEVAYVVELTRASLAEQKRIANEQLRREVHAKEVARRAAFRPHAVIITERRIASQITFCALAGGPETFLIIPFDLSQPPITFVRQAVAGLPRKAPLGASGRRYVPFFGEPIGLIINYSPDRALHYDLEGNPIEWLPAAYRVGQIELTLGSRIKSPRTVARVLGIQKGRSMTLFFLSSTTVTTETCWLFVPAEGSI